MSKFLKIAGVVLIVIIALIATILSQALTGEYKQATYGGADISNPPLPGLSTTSRNAVPAEMAIHPSTDGGMKYVTPSALSQTDKKIVKNGELTLKVDNTDEALDSIHTIAIKNSGEIFSSNFYQNGDSVKSGMVTVRVPVASFEKTFGEIKGMSALVIREATSGQDVTEEYIDLKAQLHNAITEEQTFARILDQAQKIDDVLAVTRELSRVRGSIEQLQGRINYLESQTDLSTISINLTENQNITIVDSWRPVQVVKESINSLIKRLQGFVDFMIRFFIVALPLLLIWGTIFFTIYKIGKRIYLRMKTNETSQN